MAAAMLAAPGTEYGPCAEACEHTDCAATRKMAEASCQHCGEPIGYDTRFYRSDVAHTWATRRSHPDEEATFVHALCEERLIEAERAERHAGRGA